MTRAENFFRFLQDAGLLPIDWNREQDIYRAWLLSLRRVRKGKGRRG